MFIVDFEMFHCVFQWSYQDINIFNIITVFSLFNECVQVGACIISFQ